MAERPMLFSAPMVRAILEGRKTVTRRVVKRQPEPHHWTQFAEYTGQWRKFGGTWWFEHRIPYNPQPEVEPWIRPPYQPGDRLYVRETYFGNHYLHPNEPTDEREIHYRADGREDFEGERIVWRPGIHMPKWAARIWLEVTDVRVERLWSMSAEQAIAEGFVSHLREHDAEVNLREQFAELWDSLAKPGTTWADNPWVWCISFRRVA